MNLRLHAITECLVNHLVPLHPVLAIKGPAYYQSFKMMAITIYYNPGIGQFCLNPVLNLLRSYHCLSILCINAFTIDVQPPPCQE